MKTRNKLKFSKETVRTLSITDLKNAIGGGIVTTFVSCTGGCETDYGCDTFRCTGYDCVITTALSCTGVGCDPVL